MAETNALNLIMKLKSPEDMQEVIKATKENWDNLKVAGDSIGTVHFFRFVALDDTTLGLFTTYDGDFATYVQAFVNDLGPLFDILISHAVDSTPTPVQKNPQEFLAWSKAHSLPSIPGVYSAYPDLSVQDIRALAAK